MDYALVIIFGLIVGSFLNVCIYRLPRETSIVSPGSSCPSCGMAIRFYDNIPVISYLVLRGKCRRCGASISIRYPVVELITAFLFCAVYLKAGLSWTSLALMLFSALLITLSLIDLEFQIIPDILSLGGIVAGFVFSFLRYGFGYKDALLGIFIGGGILFVIAYGYQLITKREGMGGGDIKLLGMIGAFCGLKGVIFSLVAGSLLGTIVGIPLMVMQKKDMKYAIPFGPFLSLAALVFVFFGDTIIYVFLKVLYA